MNIRRDSVAASSSSKVLDGLKSRYSCLSEPLPPDHNNEKNERRYLTSLGVFCNREVDDHDEPQSPLPSSFSKLLVDQNIIDLQIIKEKITSALSNLSFREPHLLVQFWSPVTVGKRCLLATLDQPFGLGVVDEGLYLYRLESERRMYAVDGKVREELGPPGRVYCQKLPEWSLDVHNVPARQSVQDFAACYNIHGYIVLPVFEPDSGCCVGVLELITSSDYVDYVFEVREVSRVLKEENLKSPNVFEDHSFYTQFGDERRQHELDEIFLALKTICDVQNVSLAQTWAMSGYTSVVSNSGNLEKSCSSFNRSCIGKACMSTYALPFCVRDLNMWGFHEVCRERHLALSQGVVGKSMSSCGLCFCEDVTKLGEDEYPVAPYAHVNGITSCLAIYVKSIERDFEYVIELVFPPDNANEEDLQSLVNTVKQQIKNASSVKLGITSSLQVIGGDPLNWNLEIPPTPITLLIESGEIPPEPMNQQLVLDTEQNDVHEVTFSKIRREVVYVEEHVDDDNWKNNPSDSAAAGTSQSVVPCLEARIEDLDIHKGKTRRRNSYNDKSNKPRGKRKRSERSISLEEISKHYGKTIKEAAANLRVSRSTLKRICRSLGILRWPYNNGPNKSDSLVKSDEKDSAIHAFQGTLTPVLEAFNEPSFTTNISDDPAALTKHGKHSSTLVLHQQEQTNLPDELAQPETIITEPLAENTAAANIVKSLTIKATYGENMVKFPFVLSDGLVKLEELVATRFQLSLGSFKLKYEDRDGDMILIACDSDLMESAGDITKLNNQTVIRLSVGPIVHQSSQMLNT